MSRNVRKRTFEQMRPAKNQIRLCESDQPAVLLESSLSDCWLAKDVKFLLADKGSDQTARTLPEGMFSHVDAKMFTKNSEYV